jgi:predicted NBD/HSP70 family sugar kinase
VPAKGDQGTVRALNRRLLLRLLREQGPISRTDLADRSGLSNGAVTRIVGELIDEGYLVEQSIGVSTGGRRPVLLDLDTSVRVVAGLKLMDDAILAVLVDMKGTVLTDGRVALRSHDAKTVMRRSAKAIDDLLAKISASRDRLAGVGLCMPGTIDWESGVCRLSPFFGWRDLHVAELLHDLVGVPVAVDNDVNALAVAESLFGRGRRARDFAVITLGRGVGAGLVYGGSVYRGYHGGAGEFGHQVSELDGRPCECGKLGCLEAYVGERAVLGRVHELGRRYAGLEVEAFLADARNGERALRGIYDDATRRLGAAIANLVNLVDPQFIVLGGEAAFLDEQFIDDVRPHVAQHTFGGPSANFDIHLDEWRTDRTAWARGAASLAMEHLFDPLIQSQREATA